MMLEEEDEEEDEEEMEDVGGFARRVFRERLVD